jgi:hypothetical protein
MSVVLCETDLVSYTLHVRDTAMAMKIEREVPRFSMSNLGRVKPLDARRRRGDRCKDHLARAHREIVGRRDFLRDRDL